MESLAQKIRTVVVDPGCVAICWLAQAGFVFKTQEGTIIYIDPYLTDYVQHSLPEYGSGFKRIMPSLILPEEVEADYVISTHSHADHFDAEALPVIAQNDRTHFIGAPDCEELYRQVGISDNRFTILHKGETLKLDDFSLTGVEADHGELAPDALGLWFDINGIKIWNVGDSAYRPDLWKEQLANEIDILIPPINGAFGNIDEINAAKLARISRAKIVIPCHFWMFPLHLGNPLTFLEACKQYAPDVTPLLMTQGEIYQYQKE